MGKVRWTSSFTLDTYGDHIYDVFVLKYDKFIYTKALLRAVETLRFLNKL